jgi:acyl-CoA synthetase (NDP forming)
MMMNLEQLFWAKSVAVVGASTNPSKLGHVILKNIINGGYEGRVYPVNRAGGTLLDLPVYKNLNSIPGDLDLCVMVVPANFAPELIVEGAKKGAKGAVVISGGFREAGNEALEQALVDTARANGVRLIGPNCQGFNFLPNRLCVSWPLITARGAMAIISQSGTVAAALAGWCQDEHIGCSGIVSLGNQADLCETDFIEFFLGDASTQVICLYIEGVKNGRRFIQVCKGAIKPIVVLKSGRTPGGERAAITHTRSLMGKDAVFTGVCRQTGIVRVDTIESLYDLAKSVITIKPPSGNRLMIISSSGGAGIMAVDRAEMLGLEIPELPEELKQELRNGEFPRNMIINNPLDLTGDALAEHYARVAKIIDRYYVADSLLLIFGDPIPGAADALVGLKDKLGGSFCVSYLGGGEIEKEEVNSLLSRGISVYRTPERAVQALARSAPQYR